MRQAGESAGGTRGRGEWSAAHTHTHTHTRAESVLKQQAAKKRRGEREEEKETNLVCGSALFRLLCRLLLLQLRRLRSSSSSSRRRCLRKVGGRERPRSIAATESEGHGNHTLHALALSFARLGRVRGGCRNAEAQRWPSAFGCGNARQREHGAETREKRQSCGARERLRSSLSFAALLPLYCHRAQRCNVRRQTLRAGVLRSKKREGEREGGEGRRERGRESVGKRPQSALRFSILLSPLLFSLSTFLLHSCT